MSLFEDIRYQAKNNIWPKFLGLIDTSKELLSKELLYINSTFSCSGVAIKKILLLVLVALFSWMITVFLFCALVTKLILQSFPTVNPTYLLLGSALVFSFFFVILTLVIKKQFKDLKSEILIFITHFKGYNEESTKTIS